MAGSYCNSKILVKNLLTVQETWFQPLSQEDSLKKGMTTHSNILTWRIPWTEEPGALQSMGSGRVRNEGATNTVFPEFKEKKEKSLRASNKEM